MPPLPKPVELRQRRNKAVTRATLSAENAPTKAPRLPKIDGVEWHKMTRAWWRDVWRSPMAAEYVDADKHALYRLAVLINKYWESPTQALAAEIRLQQQAFGLTPLDRRRLEWSIEQAETANTRRQQRAVRMAQAGEIDPREALRAVK
jgi:hypothetical protein